MYLIKDLEILLLSVLDYTYGLDMSPAPQTFKEHRSFIWILQILLESLMWNLMDFSDQLLDGVCKILSPVLINDFVPLFYEFGGLWGPITVDDREFNELRDANHLVTGMSGPWWDPYVFIDWPSYWSDLYTRDMIINKPGGGVISTSLNRTISYAALDPEAADNVKRPNSTTTLSEDQAMTVYMCVCVAAVCVEVISVCYFIFIGFK